MKMVSRLIVFMFIFSHTSVWAESEMDCERYKHPATQEEYRQCIRLKIAKSAGDAGVDCVDCLFEQETTGTNSWVEALSAIAQPLSYLAGSYTVAKYQNKTQQAWADAYESGHKECTNRFNSFLDYSTASGANPISASNANAMSLLCNGQGYGAYAGYGGLTSNGFGGYGNPFQMGGFTSGFMTGFGGPSWPSLGGSLNDTGMLSGAIGVGAYGTSSSSVYSTGITSAFGF